MTQKERDRLVALQKARKGLITQRQAATELSVSERQIRRLLRLLRNRGDKAECTPRGAAPRTAS